MAWPAIEVLGKVFCYIVAVRFGVEGDCHTVHC